LHHSGLISPITTPIDAKIAEGEDCNLLDESCDICIGVDTASRLLNHPFELAGVVVLVLGHCGSRDGTLIVDSLVAALCMHRLWFTHKFVS